ncbi:SAM-dependent methyltransferase (inferred from BLASTP similarity) [Trypanosoma grayi]|uniref:SAM-dependent methyltransferase (inferred from BLASTP similarity) n=1 Tax=Trypanosoma grayi TaxID=71804 RepID=UPI0004F42E76|nr:SAM-dependent methyltransferase (inferred from BLASTP similarity) [Trypanosoma grayi]KEG13028.1 SAM-dependent methyltransferase (inferred from BLASTP similarity) [Trypanosoma grayi]
MSAESNAAPAAAGAAAAPRIPGFDTEGRRYRSAEEMWARELHGDLYNAKTGWYGKALEYWSKVPATVSGVLGGMDHVHDVDIKESRAFIMSLPDRGTTRALDCGAGIGRITKSLLSNTYAVTDVLEPIPNMLEQAREELKGLPVGEFILSSMETATLKPKTYDLIVIQWAAIYLTDEDFARFLAHCKTALTPKGYIFFKENCAPAEKFIVDKEDSSLTRSDKHYKRIFATAGVEVAKEAMQEEWPNDLFKVKMYALR